MYIPQTQGTGKKVCYRYWNSCVALAMVSSNHFKWYLAPLAVTLAVICQAQAGIVIQFVLLIAAALLALLLWVSRLKRAARQSYGGVVASARNADLGEQLCVRGCSWLILFRGVIGHRWLEFWLVPKNQARTYMSCCKFCSNLTWVWPSFTIWWATEFLPQYTWVKSWCRVFIHFTVLPQLSMFDKSN